MLRAAEGTVALSISEACIDCGSCEIECSRGAVRAGAGKREIDPACCDECGGKRLCTLACPVDGILAIC